MLTKDTLKSFNAETLAEIIYTLSQQDTELSNKVQFELQTLTKNSTVTHNKMMASLASLEGMLHELTTEEFLATINELQALKHTITEILFPILPHQSLSMLLRLINLEKILSKRMDAHEDEQPLSRFMNEASRDLGVMLTQIEMPEEDKVSIVFDFYMNNDMDIHHMFIENTHKALNESGLQILKERFEEALNEKNKTVIKTGIQEIADCLRDDELFIHACTLSDEPTAIDCVEIAFRLYNCGQYEEALHWLQSRDMPIDLEWKDLYKQALIQCLESMGSFDKAQEYRQTWYEEDLDHKMYDELLHKTRLHLKPLLHKEAIEKATAFPNPIQALKFLINLGDKEALSSFVFLKIDTLSPIYSNVLNQAAEALRKAEQLAATLLYRKIIDSILAQHKVNLFNQALKKLGLCSVMNEHIKEWHGFDDHLSFVNKLKITYPNLTSFWKDFDSQQQQKNNRK